MQLIKNFFTKIHAQTIGKLPASLQSIVRKLSKICLGFFAVYLVFYLYTWPLRSKPSYSRDVSVVFNYKGEEYAINSNVKCVNKGITINEGSMEWYVMWAMSYDHQREEIVLNDGEKVKFAFDFSGNQDFWGRILEKRIKGHASVICDAFLVDDDQNKIDRATKNSFNEEQHNFAMDIYYSRRAAKDYDEYLKSVKYSNDIFNLIHIVSTEPHPNIAIMGYAGKGNYPYKPLDIRVKSVKFGEKKILSRFF